MKVVETIIFDPICMRVNFLSSYEMIEIDSYKYFLFFNFLGSDAARNVHLESSSCSTDESIGGISTEAMVLSVTDSGPGMALEDCSRMFQSTNGFDPSNLQVSTLLNEYVLVCSDSIPSY